MFTHSTQIRVHYALTDQMGFVYHGHFAQFYEIGRSEALRSLGLTYKGMEEEGVIMPVLELHTRFLRPAKYDDLLTVFTSLKEIPENSKIIFHGEIFNEQGEILNKGTVTLLFMDSKTMKRCPMPARIEELIHQFF